MAQQPAALFVDGDYLRMFYNPEGAMSRSGESGVVVSSSQEWVRDIEAGLGCSFRTKVCVLTAQEEEIGRLVGDDLPAAPKAETYAASLKRGGMQCVLTQPLFDQTTGVFRNNSVDATIATKATLLCSRGGGTGVQRFVFVGHAAYLEPVLSVLAGEGKEVFFVCFDPHGLHDELKQYAAPMPGDHMNQPGILTYTGNTRCRHPTAGATAGSFANNGAGGAKLTLASLQEISARKNTTTEQLPNNGSMAMVPPNGMGPMVSGGGRASPPAAKGPSTTGSQTAGRPPAIPGMPNPLDDIIAGFEVPAAPNTVLGAGNNALTPLPPNPFQDSNSITSANPPSATTSRSPTSAAPPYTYNPAGDAGAPVQPARADPATSNGSFANSTGASMNASPEVTRASPGPSASSRGPSQQATQQAPAQPKAPQEEEPTPSVQTTLPTDASIHFDRNTRRFYYSVVHPKTGEQAVVWEHPLGPSHQQQVEQQVSSWYDEQKAKRKIEKQKEREEFLKQQQTQVAAQQAAMTQQQPQRPPQPAVAQPVPVAQPHPTTVAQPQPAAQPQQHVPVAQPQPVPVAQPAPSNAPLSMLDPNYYAQAQGSVAGAPQQHAPTQAQVSTQSYHRPDPSRVHQVLQGHVQQPASQTVRPAAPAVAPQPQLAPVAPVVPAQPVAAPVAQPVVAPQPVVPAQPVAQAQPAATPPLAPPHEQAGLPPGWQALVDPSGKVYYIDHNTQRTSWVKPPA